MFERDITRDASDFGWAPDVWPTQFKDPANGVTYFRQIAMEDTAGGEREFLGYVYVSIDGKTRWKNYNEGIQ